jgi:hypothetical protein
MGFNGWLRSRVRTSSFVRTSWLLKDLSNNPGTKDRPTYVHADSINIQGSIITLVVGARTFTSSEIEFEKVDKEHRIENLEKPVSFYYFDVKDTSTGIYLRILVTEDEMHQALLR